MANTTHDVWILEPIDSFFGFSARNMADEISVAKSNGATSLILHINSPGGSVFEGFSIYNMLKSSGLKSTARIEGLCASIATLVAMGADNIQMSEMAQWMIHNPFVGVEGDAEKVQQTADTLKKIQDQLMAAYVSRTGKSENEISEMMKAETWLNAQQAKEMGFVDEITEPLNIAALNKKYNNNNMSNVKNAEQAKNIFSQLKTFLKNSAIIETKNGSIMLKDNSTKLYYEGETIGEGTQVFTDESMTAYAPEGDHMLEDNRMITVGPEGVVVRILEAASEAEALKKENEDLKAKIAEHESTISTLTENQNKILEEVNNKLAELEKLGIGKEIKIVNTAIKQETKKVEVPDTIQGQFKALGEEWLRKAGIKK